MSKHLRHKQNRKHTQQGLASFAGNSREIADGFQLVPPSFLFLLGRIFLSNLLFFFGDEGLVGFPLFSFVGSPSL